MQAFLPDFVMVKMDAEIGSYQEDHDPERESPEVMPVVPGTEPALGESDA